MGLTLFQSTLRQFSKAMLSFCVNLKKKERSASGLNPLDHSRFVSIPSSGGAFVVLKDNDFVLARPQDRARDVQAFLGTALHQSMLRERK